MELLSRRSCTNFQNAAEIRAGNPLSGLLRGNQATEEKPTMLFSLRRSMEGLRSLPSFELCSGVRIRMLWNEKPDMGILDIIKNALEAPNRQVEERMATANARLMEAGVRLKLRTWMEKHKYVTHEAMILRGMHELSPADVVKPIVLVEGKYEGYLMEFIEGVNLYRQPEWLTRQVLERVPGWLEELLYRIHQAGITHCDIREDNMMATEAGRLAIIDPIFRDASREKRVWYDNAAFEVLKRRMVVRVEQGYERYLATLPWGSS